MLNKILQLSNELDEKSKNIVYCVLNLLTNKVYIGYTQQTLNGRKRSHISHSKWQKDNTYFHNALNKYGKENFKWFVIYIDNSLEQLKQKEKEFIKIFKSNNKNFGYNLTTGGEQCYFNKSIKLKISQKAKERNINGKRNPFYGKHHTTETKTNWSKIRKGKPCSNPGYKHSEEIKKNLSIQAKIRNTNPDIILKLKKSSGIPVICLNNNIEYFSIKDAAEKLNFSYNALKYNFNKYKSYKGYNFKYANV